MKLILVDRRKAKVFCILVLLMGVLFGVGEVIKGQLNPVSLMQNNIKSLKEYKVLEGKISYELPSEWECRLKSFPGNQIIYHNEFVSKDMCISGFVQVWNDKEDLKTFLENSKVSSQKQNKIKNYKIKEININESQGYYINYTMKANEREYIASEYFIKYKKGFIRFSFFNNKENYKEDMKGLYNAILKTIKLK
ncbi:hypothetical protein FDJ70_01345 [Clostridium botulinum]|uniref:Conserved membrane-associated protein n=1 Tax=Clostridium botulinum D str. 1873 TaxID=592027 RepID=A0A9P2G920_CLOBO|nr:MULTISPECIES: hypothetical protein [Clostridium]AYF54056.1 hypothetical protein DFH04_04700 [Clostridium novyi]EES92172.1 conserved membrane-associated protein [Clostridium botulinum D str. 1873]MBO3442674.1 hypothetical protein [Clostridium haemolyticum]MCD3216808.1 hypothetical protein [Clostridium botulinum C]MCD3245620.1 hypothetical protein [Clostridium botulinum C]